jgi:hypothetical protein
MIPLQLRLEGGLGAGGSRKTRCQRLVNQTLRHTKMAQGAQDLGFVIGSMVEVGMFP